VGDLGALIGFCSTFWGFSEALCGFFFTAAFYDSSMYVVSGAWSRPRRGRVFGYTSYVVHRLGWEEAKV
jgi:hypothetical protein